MMLGHLVEDLPHPILPEPLPKRMSYSRFQTSLVVTCLKYPRTNLSHKALSLTASSISVTIGMLGHRAVEIILLIFCQHRIWKVSILLLSSVLNIHVSMVYMKTWRTSDCMSLFLVFLEILLLHVTLCHLIITGLIRTTWRCISANKLPSASIMEPKYVKELAFSYSLRTVKGGRHLAQSTTMTFVFDACRQSPSFSTGYLH